jgi:hypothetical protein
MHDFTPVLSLGSLAAAWATAEEAKSARTSVPTGNFKHETLKGAENIQSSVLIPKIKSLNGAALSVSPSLACTSICRVILNYCQVSVSSSFENGRTKIKLHAEYENVTQRVSFDMFLQFNAGKSYITIHFVPHRKHITSPLQRPTG